MAAQTSEERVAELHRQAARDYGTPQERAERSERARENAVFAVVYGNETAAAR